MGLDFDSQTQVLLVLGFAVLVVCVLQMWHYQSVLKRTAEQQRIAQEHQTRAEALLENSAAEQARSAAIQARHEAIQAQSAALVSRQEALVAREERLLQRLEEKFLS